MIVRPALFWAGSHEQHVPSRGGLVLSLVKQAIGAMLLVEASH